MHHSTGVSDGPTETHRTAGSGAAQQVEGLERRLAEKHAQLAGLQHQITGLEQSLHRWRSGLAGERHVGALLDGLADAGWVALHDLRWPGRPKANLDHVVVGPGGVVVIDTKNWSAPVAVRLDGVLQVGGSARATSSRAAATMTAAVAAVLPPQHRTAVAGALCFTGQPVLPALTRDGVVAVGDAHLTDWLRGLQPWLAPDEVREIADHLRRELGGPESPDLLTTAATAPRVKASRSGHHPRRRPVRTRPKGRRAAPEPASKGPRRLVLLAGAVAAFVGASSWMTTFGPLVAP